MTEGFAQALAELLQDGDVCGTVPREEHEAWLAEATKVALEQLLAQERPLCAGDVWALGIAITAVGDALLATQGEVRPVQLREVDQGAVAKSAVRALLVRLESFPWAELAGETLERTAASVAQHAAEVHAKRAGKPPAKAH